MRLPAWAVWLLAFAACLDADPGKVLFSAAGDVMISRDVADKMRKEGSGVPFSGIAPILKTRDLAFCNLEGTLSDRGAPRGKGFLFRSHPDSVAGLFSSGFNMFSLANNHANDFGSNALLDTRMVLEKHGFHCAGAADNAWGALEPAMIEKNGLRIAFFAFRELPFKGGKPRDPQPAVPDSQSLVASIRAARLNADFVIVSYHWGVKYRHLPTLFQKRFAELSIDAGADLVLGHHPHALQPIVKYKEKFIFYSLGNCIFDQEFPMANESILVSCTLEKHAVSDMVLMPLLIRNCRPEPASGGDLARITGRIRDYCASAGITLTAKGPQILVK